MRLALACLAVLALPACVIEWGDDPDPPCAYDTQGALRTPDPGLVNPETLQCESFGYPCDDQCGPCPLAADIASPSWGSCASECRNLDEYTCGNTAGCRTTYDDYCLNGGGPCTAEVAFLGCQPVDTSGPIQGVCDGLAAWDCSRHDDCLSTFRFDANGSLRFSTCQPELTFRCGISEDCA